MSAARFNNRPFKRFQSLIVAGSMSVNLLSPFPIFDFSSLFFVKGKKGKKIQKTFNLNYDLF